MTNSDFKGIKLYLERLTHNIGNYNIRFDDVEFEIRKDGKINIYYDLHVKTKQKDIPWLSSYFDCKSSLILEQACDIVGFDFKNLYKVVKDIYINNFIVPNYEGYIPDSFQEKIKNEVIKKSPKILTRQFFCGNEKKIMKLYVNYDISDIYNDSDSGFILDISAYCYKLTIDDKLVENLNQDIVDIIVGYMNEDNEDFKIPGDNVIWDEVSKYMDLSECDLYGHTYAYLRSIGDYWSDSWDYIGKSQFSNRMCDFLMGEG